MITMFDSIYPSQLPGGVAAVAGYVNGHWPTYGTLVKQFPKAHVLSIDVFGNGVADCIDVENGDATIPVAVEWVKRRQAQGLRRPVVYTSVSQAQALLNALRAAGIRRSDIRLWTAHYDFRPHICTPQCWRGFTDQADATQYTDHAKGQTLREFVDESLVSNAFFGTVPSPAPMPSSGDPAPNPEPKNQGPFTRVLWPNPVPQWFWAWAWWRKNCPKDPQAQAAWRAARPAQAPTVIPAWAWLRLAAL